MRTVENTGGWRWWRAAAAVFICMLATVPSLPAQDVSAKVQQILNTPQRYSGSMIIDLAQLGSPAVPALTESLYTYRFPLVILRALQRINDPSAAAPVLTFINRISADPDRQEEVLMSIALLRELGYTPAESSLHLLMTDQQAQLATRLAAGSALAKWGSPAVRTEAAVLIVKAAQDHPPGTRALRDDVLDEALASIGSAESRALLIERLNTAPMTAEQGRIVHLLAGERDPEVASALLAVAEAKGRNAHLRLDAAKTLVDSGMDFPRDRLLAAVKQVRTMLPPYLQAQADELCRRLGP